jgi:hypothetical protein
MSLDLDKKQKQYSIEGAGVQSAFARFQNADLVANVYSFNHKLETKYPLVLVYDDTDSAIIPDAIVAVNENRVSIDLTSFAPISGVYKVRAVGQ